MIDHERLLGIIASAGTAGHAIGGSMTWHRFTAHGRLPLTIAVTWPRPRKQFVIPRWVLWAIILGATAVAWFGCQQPFYVPQGVNACPKGQHAYYDRNNGWLCAADSTALQP